ncbi:FMN-binding negative transcriptional regulator [Streptomyces sp. bgisy084]|uniref:FMN-binding negative transcriptional regulator n=1 Tax=Streptomyces sp. bgisy084 TaxID=3413777 RepID=UPI003D722734
MLINKWDAAMDDLEWREWLANGHDFGQVIANGRGRAVPVVVPTHFLYDGSDVILLHLARPNPIWAALEENTTVLLSVVDDWAYIPTTWRAAATAPIETGVPTSYYSAIQITATANIVDSPAGKAQILRRHLTHLQPAGDFAPVVPDKPPYGKLLSALRGLELHVTSVAAKFKYDDHKPMGFRRDIADHLEGRSDEHDAGARREQLRRIEACGELDP